MYTIRRSRAVPREMRSSPRSASEGRSVPSMTTFATELTSAVVFLPPECAFALWYAAGMTSAMFVGQHARTRRLRRRTH